MVITYYGLGMPILEVKLTNSNKINSSTGIVPGSSVSQSVSSGQESCGRCWR